MFYQKIKCIRSKPLGIGYHKTQIKPYITDKVARIFFLSDALINFLIIKPH